MKNIHSIQMVRESNEEHLPWFDLDFLYSSYTAELDQYIGAAVPWHWHRTVELFFMESGTLEYTTPNCKIVFPAGSGGFLNSNILHSTKVISSEDAAIQLLHQFKPEFLSGGQGNRMDTKYIRPVTEASGIEIIPLFPNDDRQKVLLHKIRSAFDLDEKEWGYEFAIRQKLAEIWLDLHDLVRSDMQKEFKNQGTDEKMKTMMRYIYAHYSQPITVDQLAKEVHVSKRVCFRMFQENLHMTPVEYIKSYRLSKACQRLIESDDPVTQIAFDCGFGSNSYFGKLFRERFGCTPAQYRKDWHDNYINKRI